MFVNLCVALLFFTLCSNIDGRPAGNKKTDIRHTAQFAKTDNGAITFLDERPAMVPVVFEDRFGIRVGTCPIGYVRRGFVCFPS